MANYVLTVKLDPSQLNAQLKKFQDAFGGGMGGGGGAQSGLKGALGKLQNAINGIKEGKSGGLGKAASFGFMALGIMELVKLVKGLFSMVVDSSPMLKAMMGLLNNSIMFILRPIGDFIGFMLRPILLVFLRYIALPFYKHFYPIMQKYGNVIGEGLANLLLLAINFFTDPAGTIGKGLADAFSSIDVTKIFKGLPDFSKIKLPDLSGLGSNLSKSVIGWFDRLPKIDFTSVFRGLDSLKTNWTDLTTWFGHVAGNASGILASNWNKLTGFFSSLASDAGSWVKDRWASITKFFSSIATDSSGWLVSRWNDLTKFFASIASDVGGWVKNIWSGITGAFKSFYNAIADVYNWIAGGAKNFGLNLPAMKKMANGGIIDEPVVGVGQTTGRGYLLGESGAERVSPVGSGGGGNSINIYVNAPIFGISDLKAVILATVQEANSRRRRQ